MKYLRFLYIFISLLVFDYAVAAVNYSIIPNARILIVPGVDLIRHRVSNLTISSDQPYSIEIRDVNGGFMVNGYHEIPYKISYNGGIERRLSRNSVLLESGESVSDTNREIAVTIFGSDTAKAVAGDYTTTLTVTITAF